MPSTTIDIQSVSSAKLSILVKVETSISQPKAATPVMATVKDPVSYHEASLLDLEKLLKYQLNSKTKDLCVEVKVYL